MPGFVHIDEGQLRAAASHCRHTSEELGAELARLVRRVESLASGSLTGMTGVALQSVFASLDGNLTRMRSALDETADLLDESSSTLSALDQSAARAISAGGGSDIGQALRPADDPA